MVQQNRRQFLQESMLATTAALSSAAPVVAAEETSQQSVGPQEKLAVAVLGIHGQGTVHCDSFVNNPHTEIRYIVDPDQQLGLAQAAAVGERQGRQPEFVTDMRRAFDDPALDIVSIATPNHWHALAGIWAMQAGKDVYVEKPCSHYPREGRSLVAAARKYGRICQHGTQGRTHTGIRQAIDYLHSGQLGEVKLARGLCYDQRDSVGPAGNHQVPSHIDYSLWCGPAPQRAVTRRQFHYDWHWQWDYGNGNLGNQGIHQMDIARWGLGVDCISQGVIGYGGRWGYSDCGQTPNTIVVVHDYGSKTLVFEVRGLQTNSYRRAGVGVIFEASDGYLVNTSATQATAFDRDGQVIKRFGGGDRGHQLHFDNFVDAVLSRRMGDLHAEIAEGHASSALCHLGNISYRLGDLVSTAEALERLDSVSGSEEVRMTFDRTRKHLEANQVNLAKTRMRMGTWLKFDPDREIFIDNPEAETFLARSDRQGFVVPAPDQV